MFGILLAKKQRQVTSDKVADAGNKMLESEGDEEADDNEDEENQVSSCTASFRGTTIDDETPENGRSSGDTVGHHRANLSYRKLVTVNAQLSCSIFDDKTGNYRQSPLESGGDSVCDIQQESGESTGVNGGINGRGTTNKPEPQQEFGTDFKDKLEGDNLRYLANKTSENAQLKRFKLDEVSLQRQQQQQQQDDQMPQGFPLSSVEQSNKPGSARNGGRVNSSSDAKQQSRSMTSVSVATMEATGSPKQNGSTRNEMISNGSDYMVSQNRGDVQPGEIQSHSSPAVTSLAEMGRPVVGIVADEAVDCEASGGDDDDDADDGSSNREDEQASVQVAAVKHGMRLEYGSFATRIPDERYDRSSTAAAAACRSPALKLPATISPSNAATALFGGQGQPSELPSKDRPEQRQQESRSAVGTNQVLMGCEQTTACTERVSQVEAGDGGLHSSPGFNAMRRQPLRRTWQQQKQQPELATTQSPCPPRPPPQSMNNPQQSSRNGSRLLLIAQHHNSHTSSSDSGDGEQKRASPFSAFRGRPGQQQNHHAPGGDGNDRSSASYRNENYENHIHLEQPSGDSSGGGDANNTILGNNKEKWSEQSTQNDATARSAAFVNKSPTRDEELYRLAMIDQGEKKETMTENLKQYPPNHPLGNSKHLCAICGDRATGKHYGVFSCEGCKGFFKRTIRKDIVYVCRAQGDCLIDMRQRNRCQYCRYQKCLTRGMKREAVQEEKQRLKLRAAATENQLMQNQQTLPSDIVNSNHVFNQCDTSEIKLDSTNHYNQYNLDHHPGSSPPNFTTGGAHPIGSHYNRYTTAYHSNSLTDIGGSFRLGPMRIDELTLKWAAQVQIECLLDWAKSVPKFTGLLIDDQVTLMKAYWNELIIAHIAFKTAEALREGTLPGGGSSSSDKLNSLCIGRGLFIDAYQAYDIGLGNVFDRIIDELVVKMRDMRLDANELACLRAIILFNPETHGLKTSQPIEEYRGDIYTTLEVYCRRNYENQPNRFGKLLLRLPALRSIGLKCDSMRQQRRCDTSITCNQIVAASHQGFVTRLSPASRGSSSPTNSSISSISSTSTSAANTVTGTNPNCKYGYQVNLLFFGLCYEMSSIDSFLRSSFSLN